MLADEEVNVLLPLLVTAGAVAHPRSGDTALSNDDHEVKSDVVRSLTNERLL